MQRLEVSGAVRPIYGSLGVKRLRVMSKTLHNSADLGIQNNNFASHVTNFETQSLTLHEESKLRD